jgi:hypothetical protein
LPPLETILGVSDKHDGIERGLQLQGERLELEQGDTITVSGTLRVVVHPASQVNGQFIPQWVELRMSTPALSENPSQLVLYVSPHLKKCLQFPPSFAVPHSTSRLGVDGSGEVIVYPNWRHRNPDPPVWTDTMQVCMNGHQITVYAVSSPHGTKAHCPDCGAKTITQCPKCQTAIPGGRHGEYPSLCGMETPAHCQSCGAAFPWKDNLQAIAVAREAANPKKKGKGASTPQNVYNAPVIHANTITHSPILQGGTKSTLSLSVSDEGASAKEVIRLILEVLDDLQIEPSDKDEVRSDAKTVLTQLESPKPKMGIVRSLFSAIREKIVSAVAGKVSSYAVDKAQEAIQGIDIIQSLGGTNV